MIDTNRMIDSSQSLPARTPNRPSELAAAFARALSGADGDLLLGWLHASVIARRLASGASDTELRHAEGQRELAARIIALVQAGTGGDAADIWSRIGQGARRLVAQASQS